MDAFARQDRPLAARAAHTLRSAAASIGAPELAALSREVEHRLLEPAADPLRPDELEGLLVGIDLVLLAPG